MILHGRWWFWLSVLLSVCSGGFTEGEGAAALPCRLWASHEEGENNEKIDTVDTIILIHSAI